MCLCGGGGKVKTCIVRKKLYDQMTKTLTAKNICLYGVNIVFYLCDLSDVTLLSAETREFGWRDGAKRWVCKIHKSISGAYALCLFFFSSCNLVASAFQCDLTKEERPQSFDMDLDQHSQSQRFILLLLRPGSAIGWRWAIPSRTATHTLSSIFTIFVE